METPTQKGTAVSTLVRTLPEGGTSGKARVPHEMVRTGHRAGGNTRLPVEMGIHVANDYLRHHQAVNRSPLPGRPTAHTKSKVSFRPRSGSHVWTHSPLCRNEHRTPYHQRNPLAQRGMRGSPGNGATRRRAGPVDSIRRRSGPVAGGRPRRLGAHGRGRQCLLAGRRRNTMKNPQIHRTKEENLVDVIEAGPFYRPVC